VTDDNSWAITGEREERATDRSHKTLVQVFILNISIFFVIILTTK
jgi:hypothetical protein